MCHIERRRKASLLIGVSHALTPQVSRKQIAQAGYFMTARDQRYPGETELTRMPVPCSSVARTLVSMFSETLEIRYSGD